MRTGLKTVPPHRTFTRIGSRALCSDGVIRSLTYLARIADTYFSVKAAVTVKGEYVKDYVTTEVTSPLSKGYKVRRAAVTFRQLSGQDTSLPDWDTVGDDYSDSKHEMFAVACDGEPNT